MTNVPTWLKMPTLRVSALTLFTLAALHAHAQTGTVDAVIAEQVKAEEAAKSSQKKVAQLDEEASRMLAEYRQMLAESQSLKSYNQQLEVQVVSQQTEVDTITRQLVEIETTSREVQPMMQRMVATLAEFVKLDAARAVEMIDQPPVRLPFHFSPATHAAAVMRSQQFMGSAIGLDRLNSLRDPASGTSQRPLQASAR